MKAFHDSENDKEYVLVFIELILDCVECVHQFKESILRRFSWEHQRTRSHFAGIRFWPFQKGTERNPFCYCRNGWECFLDGQRTIFKSKESVPQLQGTAKNAFLWTKKFFFHLWTRSLNYRTLFLTERQVSIFLWKRFLPFFFMNIFHWVSLNNTATLIHY